MIYVASIACLIVGFIAGVLLTCRAVTIMQEDFVKIMGHGPKGK